MSDKLTEIAEGALRELEEKGAIPILLTPLKIQGLVGAVK